MQALKLNPLTYEFKFSKEETPKFFLASDIHLDNPKCKRELFFRHMDAARKKNAKVVLIGDTFCAMQGKYDPRRSKKDVRPEHNKPDYLNALVADTVNVLSPYSDIIALISDGNHETAVLKNVEYDLVGDLVKRLNERNKTNILRGGYRGWMVIRYGYAKNTFTSYKIYFNHGFGGGGEMTKGILQHARMNMYVENADAIQMGHVHELYALPTQTEYFDASPTAYKPKTRTIYNLRTSTYKDEYDGIEGGYHIEKGRQPKPLGGIFMELDPCREGTTNKLHPSYTIWTD
jgi:hypothetical protein